MPEATLLDGKDLARETRKLLKERAAHLIEKGVTPRIEAIVAAQDPASLAYVGMKQKWAEKIGMESGVFHVTQDVTHETLLEKIDQYNRDPKVHGVLVQHPMPGHVKEHEALIRLGAQKDVDGISPESLGLLMSDLPGFRCATPLGMIRLLEHYQVDCEGMRAVVIGRSVILGKPMALMLLRKQATVTVAHSRTRELPELVKQADIVVAAVGRPEMVRGDWIKPGAVVLDAGYNKVEGRDSDVGDCHFEECAEKASFITPVPGGVGPMTVASLLSNTVDAAEKALA
jgi:methylenetetrahydrofolate dehydrogenase (NADP+)/methenyltetrahydrofolate cyclohydrolase